MKYITYREGICEECGNESCHLIETTLGWICERCMITEVDRL